MSFTFRRLKYHAGIVAVLTTLTLFASNALAQGMTKVNVNGVSVRVYGSANQGYIVVAGDRVVIEDDGDSSVSIYGIFEGNGRTYVMVAENCGGSACGDLFQAIDMSGPKYRVSPVFGTGVVGAKPEVRDGALLLTQTTGDQTATFRYSYKDGKLDTEKQVSNLEATGPEKAPGGDMAAFANGKHMSEIFKLRATAVPLRGIMGDTAFEDARSVALNDFGGTFAEKSGIVSASGCQPHDCGAHSISVAFDHDGHVWASLVRNSARAFYGNPNVLVKMQLQ